MIFAILDYMHLTKDERQNHLDLNLHFARLNSAIQIGKALNQIAIFDRKLKKVINLK